MQLSHILSRMLWGFLFYSVWGIVACFYNLRGLGFCRGRRAGAMFSIICAVICSLHHKCCCLWPHLGLLKVFSRFVELRFKVLFGVSVLGPFWAYLGFSLIFFFFWGGVV